MEKIDFVCMEDEKPGTYFSAALGWYLHGELEKIAGFDLTWSSVDPKKVETGIYPCTFNNSIDAILFCWSINYGERNRLRGLIVKKDDYEAIKDAQTKFDNKKEFL